MSSKNKEAPGFGIGEWFGRLVHTMGEQEKLQFAHDALNGNHASHICPYRSAAGLSLPCNKAGGVCGIRKYLKDTESGSVRLAEGEDGVLRTVCPNRFHEAGLVEKWVGEVVLGDSDPIVVTEIGFLESVLEGKSSDVGRIDSILVSRAMNDSLGWCALEIQSVYFQGGSMKSDFKHIIETKGLGLPFPTKRRQPDYRSSGPKRLMPQLQIKVPSLRRWGKKMAVVVDKAFFANLGNMDPVSHISNADIIWFVLDYRERDGTATLHPHSTHFITLERAVEGLTAGTPVSKEEFERRIREKVRSISK